MACVTALAQATRASIALAHGGVLDCLYRAAGARRAERAPRTRQLGNGSINRLYTPQGLTMVGWADTGT